jgi:hypothetical protein
MLLPLQDHIPLGILAGFKYKSDKRKFSAYIKDGGRLHVLEVLARQDIDLTGVDIESIPASHMQLAAQALIESLRQLEMAEPEGWQLGAAPGTQLKLPDLDGTGEKEYYKYHWVQAPWASLALDLSKVGGVFSATMCSICDLRAVRDGWSGTQHARHQPRLALYV